MLTFTRCQHQENLSTSRMLLSRIVSEKKNDETIHDIFWTTIFDPTLDCVNSALPYQTFILNATFLFLKFISRVRFENVLNVKRNTMALFNLKKKRSLRDSSKPRWVSVVNFKLTIFKKISVSFIAHIFLDISI